MVVIETKKSYKSKDFNNREYRLSIARKKAAMREESYKDLYKK